MNRTYFLGCNSPTGFTTSFWQAHRDFYGYYLKGGPGSGKSTLMKRIAATFGTEKMSLYYCSSDPESLDAIVLEERGVFVADATAPHEQTPALPYVTGEQVDLADCLDAQMLQSNRTAIQALYAENQAAHERARRGMQGFSAMQETVWQIGEKALLTEKAVEYAKRLAKRILKPQKHGDVFQSERISAAFTPNGWQTLTPDNYDTIILEDGYGCAASLILNILASSALSEGVPCEIGRNYIQPHLPILQLVFPTLQLTILTVTPFSPCDIAAIQRLKLQRFYDANRLKSQKTLTKFCVHTAQSMSSHITEQLRAALVFHDDLERYYISAQNRIKLSGTAEKLISKISMCRKTKDTL